MNWRRGVFRLWLVLAVLWIGFIAWDDYRSVQLRPSPIAEDCFNRFGKWPDGTSFSDENWDDVSTPYDPSAPDSELSPQTLARKHAFVAAWARIKDCSAAGNAAKPISQRVSDLLRRNDSVLWDFLVLGLLPPIGLLVAGFIVGWIVKGFALKPQP